jgi:hypothetical protein
LATAASTPESAPAATGLPELAAVYWRPRVDPRRLRRSARLWTLTTVAHTVPFLAAAALLVALKPVTAPVALILVAHAWAIPELYAARGAGVVRIPPGSTPAREPATAGAQARALGLLGDLVGHEARDLLAATGLVLESGRLGVWLVGEAGAILVAPGGRRVFCYCVAASDSGLPVGDRIAHLLLALREDETGLATVANLAFSGAVWRLRRRLAPVRRPALARAVQASRRA